jgi:8-oxo-dGTP pyrophosphatase MutT (NUDIX family)
VAVARPRDAASMLVYDGTGVSLKVLLGRRPARARFMPDVFVYPGGAVDATDFPARGEPGDYPGFTSLVGAGNCPRKARALAQAAIRETREETGLKLSCDAGRLRYLGRAITPTESALRFHARFFAAPGSLFKGELAGDGELLDLDWFSLDAARALPLVDVTRFMLEKLLRSLAGAKQDSPLLCYRGERALVRYR